MFELGVGIHGEPGCETVPAMSVNEIAARVIDEICRNIEPQADEPPLLKCNGLGDTPQSEIYVLFDAAVNQSAKRGLTVARSLVGNYCTSLEMHGASLAVTRLSDETLTLWDAPVVTSSLRWGKQR